MSERARWIGLVAAAGLLLGACAGGSSADGAAPPTTEATTTTRPPTTTTTIAAGSLMATAEQALAYKQAVASVTICATWFGTKAPTPECSQSLFDLQAAADALAAGAGNATASSRFVGVLRTLAANTCRPTSCATDFKSAQAAFEAQFSPQVLTTAQGILDEERRVAGDAARTLTYEVSGSGSAMVTYSIDGFGQSQETVRLPWSKKILDGQPEYPILSAQLQGSGSVTCRIKRGDQVLTEVTSSGAYTIASCDGS